MSYVGNYAKPGPSTTQRPPLFHTGAEVVSDGSVWVRDNVLTTDSKATANNWRGLGSYYFERQRLAAPQPFDAPAVKTDAADVAYRRVLDDVGATLPPRDAVDTRVIRETREGSGHIVRSVAEAGGWPDFPATTKP